MPLEAAAPVFPCAFVDVAFPAAPAVRGGGFVGKALPFVVALSEPVIREDFAEETEDVAALCAPFVLLAKVFPAVLCELWLVPEAAVEPSVPVPGPPQAVSSRHIPASRAKKRHSVFLFKPGSSSIVRYRMLIIEYFSKNASERSLAGSAFACGEAAHPAALRRPRKGCSCRTLRIRMRLLFCNAYTGGERDFIREVRLNHNSQACEHVVGVQG